MVYLLKMVVFHGCVKMVTFAHWAPKSSLITGDMIWCVCKNSTAWVVILQITMRRVQGYPSCQALMICNLLHGKSRKQTTFCCNGAVLTCCSTQTLHFKRPPLTPGHQAEVSLFWQQQRDDGCQRFCSLLDLFLNYRSGSPHCEGRVPWLICRSCLVERLCLGRLGP